MTILGTQLDAIQTLWFIKTAKCKIKTIINVGVGSAPEADIWKWLCPDVCVVGIDPRPKPRQWKYDYVKAAACSKVFRRKFYCRRCRAMLCRSQERHKEHLKERLVVHVVTTTVDIVSRSYEPPYLLWVDVDGSELDVLEGSTETMKHTPFIHVEMIPPGTYSGQIWDGDRTKRVHWYLRRSGYKIRKHYSESHDSLYMKRPWNFNKAD